MPLNFLFILFVFVEESDLPWYEFFKKKKVSAFPLSQINFEILGGREWKKNSVTKVSGVFREAPLPPAWSVCRK